MFTNIKTVTNQQPSTGQGGVAFANNQPGHAGEGWACIPGFSAEIGRYLPVPLTSNFAEGLWVYTTRGRCQVIDNDWTISGQWDGGTVEIFVQKGQGAGGNIKVTVDSQGNISMIKA